MVDGKVENILSVGVISADVLHFRSIHFETFTVGLRQSGISDIELECLQHFLNLWEFLCFSYSSLKFLVYLGDLSYFSFEPLVFLILNLFNSFKFWFQLGVFFFQVNNSSQQFHFLFFLFLDFSVQLIENVLLFDASFLAQNLHFTHIPYLR